MNAAELRGANKPSLNEALGWIGSRVDDIYGANVGRLDDVWIDPGTGAPRWLLVKEGRFGGRTTLIPFEDATAGAGHVWIPYEREVVREAPEVAPGAPLTQQVEGALRRHYRAKTGTGVSSVGNPSRHGATAAERAGPAHAAHAYSDPPSPQPPAYGQDRRQRYATGGAPAPAAQPSPQAYAAPDHTEHGHGHAYAAPPPPPEPQRPSGGAYEPPSGGAYAYRQPAEPPAPPAPRPQPPEHVYRSQPLPRSAPGPAELQGPTPDRQGQQGRAAAGGEPFGEQSAAGERPVAVPVIHGLDRPYRVEIQLEGDLRISGELKDFRLTPSNQSD